MEELGEAVEVYGEIRKIDVKVCDQLKTVNGILLLMSSLFHMYIIDS